MTFLVDTGADISLCKVTKQIIDEEYYPGERCKLTGISEEEIYSMGTINLKLLIGNNTYINKLQLVNEKFPIETDGIIVEIF